SVSPSSFYSVLRPPLATLLPYTTLFRSRLAGHLDQDAACGDRLETAGVDHDVRIFAHPPFAIVAVAGQPGDVRHQRRARTRQAVEQGRFADIRAPDQGHDRLEASISHRRPPGSACHRPSGPPPRAEWTPGRRRPARRPPA